MLVKQKYTDQPNFKTIRILWPRSLVGLTIPTSLVGMTGQTKLAGLRCGPSLNLVLKFSIYFAGWQCLSQLLHSSGGAGGEVVGMKGVGGGILLPYFWSYLSPGAIEKIMSGSLCARATHEHMFTIVRALPPQHPYIH